jgi:hypothetical protein
MASSEPSRKWGREEVPPPPPAEPEEVPPPLPAEPEEVPPPLRAPKVNFEDAYFSVKMLYQAWQSLGKVAVHLVVQQPTDPLQATVMDYAFKVNALAGQLEREVPPPSTTTTTMAASTSPASTLTPTPTVGLLRRLLPLLN